MRQDSWQFRKPHKKFIVPMETVDHVVEQLGVDKKILIKIDVEDFEASVLRGAIATLKMAKPIIICEMLPREHGNQETYDILLDSDYTAYGISKDGLIKFGRDDFFGHRSITDFLVAHNSVAPLRNYIPYDDLSRYFQLNKLA